MLGVKYFKVLDFIEVIYVLEDFESNEIVIFVKKWWFGK